MILRDVLQVKGKVAKDRVIPIKKLLADRLRKWKAITGGGYVARSLAMKKELGDSMSGVAIFQLVNKYGNKINIPNSRRMTCAARMHSWAMRQA